MVNTSLPSLIERPLPDWAYRCFPFLLSGPLTGAPNYITTTITTATMTNHDYDSDFDCDYDYDDEYEYDADYEYRL